MAKELTEVQKVKRELKERDKITKEYERYKKNGERICAKIRAMSKEERVKFFAKISDKLKIVEAKIKDQQSKKEKAKNEDYCELDKADKLLINGISCMVCGVSTGLLVGFTKGEEIGCLSTICASLAGFWMVGPLAGMGIRNKRIFNAIKKLKVTTAKKNIVKFKSKQMILSRGIMLIKRLNGEDAVRFVEKSDRSKFKLIEKREDLIPIKKFATKEKTK